MIFKLKWTWNIIYKRIAALLFVEPNAFWYICRFYMIHLQFIHVMLFCDSGIIYSSSYKLYLFLHDSSTVHTCILKPDTWPPIPPWFCPTWSWNASSFEPTWHSHTGWHVKDNGTGPHSLSSTTFFCSAMAERGAQGARRGATVHAWRVAGTCAWNRDSKSQEANTPK
jgi:hypothetical protein